MAVDKNNYKTTLKNTSLFGGVQIVNIIISIVRSKVVAVLIGPVGMGIVGLYDSTLSMINMLTSMGLSTSAVKDISEANSNGDEKGLVTVASAFKHLVWLTGLLGTVVCLVLSPLLSRITFGNRDYTLGFVCLSISLLFRQLTSGQTTLMQGLRRYGIMAKASVYGNVIGLVVTIILYYFGGINAIVPVLLAANIVPFFVTLFYSKKIQLPSETMRLGSAFIVGKSMLKMGFMVSIGSLLSLVASYIVRIYIGKWGGLAEVGLYTAGFALINGYVGMVFNAMGSDYYPRLSAVNKDDEKLTDVVNSQIEISLLIIGPIVSFFIVFIYEIVLLLYSDKFLGVGVMLYWAIMGVFFKAISWCLAFVLLSRGDSKMYAINEAVVNLYTVLLNVLFYRFAGLAGLGISFLVSYMIYTIQMWVVVSIKHRVKLSKQLITPFSTHLILSILCLIVIFTQISIWKYILGSLLCVSGLTYSIFLLDKRTGFIKVLRNRVINNN